jgi:hypothetical protein
VRLDPGKWYFDTYVYVIAFLCIGPLALPVVWINPRYNGVKKTVITAISLVVSALLAVSFANSMGSILKYYQQVLQLSKGGAG